MKLLPKVIFLSCLLLSLFINSNSFGFDVVIKSPEGDEVLLDLDSCFKGTFSLGDSCSEDPTTGEPKKKKRKAGPLIISPHTKGAGGLVPEVGDLSDHALLQGSPQLILSLHAHKSACTITRMHGALVRSKVAPLLAKKGGTRGVLEAQVVVSCCTCSATWYLCL